MAGAARAEFAHDVGMPRFRLLLLFLAAAALAPPVGLGATHGRITQASIGGVGLGLRAADYARVLGERGFTTRYANGTTRLHFPKAEISVLLDRRGRGVRVTTAAREYTLASGIGPCSPLDRLARAHTLTPVALRGPFGTTALVYRNGRLWFTLSDARHVGSVTLAAGQPAIQALIGAAQCGVGDEEGK